MTEINDVYGRGQCDYCEAHGDIVRITVVESPPEILVDRDVCPACREWLDEV